MGCASLALCMLVLSLCAPRRHRIEIRPCRASTTVNVLYLDASNAFFGGFTDGTHAYLSSGYRFTAPAQRPWPGYSGMWPGVDGRVVRIPLNKCVLQLRPRAYLGIPGRGVTTLAWC